MSGKERAKWAVGVVAFLVGTLLATEVHGQKRVSVDGHGGIAIPTGRLADVAKAGPTLGLQMSYPLGSKTAVRVRGDLDDLGGARLGSARAPDMKLWRAGVGFDRDLIGERASESARGRRVARSGTPWALAGTVGVGAARFDSRAFTVTGPTPVTRSFRETYLATDVGLTLRYRASDRVRLRAGTHGSLAFADKKDTAILAALDPRGQAKAFGSTLTVPVSVGFTIRM